MYSFLLVLELSSKLKIYFKESLLTIQSSFYSIYPSLFFISYYSIKVHLEKGLADQFFLIEALELSIDVIE